MGRRKKSQQVQDVGEEEKFIPRVYSQPAAPAAVDAALCALGWVPTNKSRAYWIEPGSGHEHSWPVAELIATGKEVDGEPFAPPEDLKAALKAERAERRAAALAERESIKAERREEFERKKAERALKL